MSEHNISNLGPLAEAGRVLGDPKLKRAFLDAARDQANRNVQRRLADQGMNRRQRRGNAYQDRRR